MNRLLYISSQSPRIAQHYGNYEVREINGIEVAKLISDAHRQGRLENRLSFAKTCNVLAAAAGIDKLRYDRDRGVSYVLEDGDQAIIVTLKKYEPSMRDETKSVGLHDLEFTLVSLQAE